MKTAIHFCIHYEWRVHRLRHSSRQESYNKWISVYWTERTSAETIDVMWGSRCSTRWQLLFGRVWGYRSHEVCHSNSQREPLQTSTSDTPFLTTPSWGRQIFAHYWISQITSERRMVSISNFQDISSKYFTTIDIDWKYFEKFIMFGVVNFSNTCSFISWHPFQLNKITFCGNMRLKMIKGLE